MSHPTHVNLSDSLRMEETPQQQERIERYLRGELPAAERDRFATELSADPKLRRRVALHRELDTTFADPAEAEFRATLRAVDRRTSAGRRGRWLRLATQHWWALAASLLLLIAAVIYMIDFGAPPPPATLAAAAYEPYPIDVFRSEADATALPTDILTPYRAGEYGLAAERIAALPAYAESPQWQFYRAVALVGDGQGSPAVSALRELRAADSLPGRAEAIDWYLALALLQAEEVEAARALLRRIADSPTHYQRKAARRLLRRR